MNAEPAAREGGFFVGGGAWLRDFGVGVVMGGLPLLYNVHTTQHMQQVAEKAVRSERAQA